MGSGELASCCLGELGEVSEEVMFDLDLEWCTTGTAESGSWTSISPLVIFTLQKLLVFMNTGKRGRDLLGALPGYSEERERTKRHLGRLSLGRTLPWQMGVTKEKGKGLTPKADPTLCLGIIHRFTSCWWLPVWHGVGNPLSIEALGTIVSTLLIWLNLTSWRCGVLHIQTSLQPLLWFTSWNNS